MSSSRPLIIVKIASDLALRAAEIVAALASEAISLNGQFSICLCGGSTPRHLYELLASNYAMKIDWRKTRVFWGDERCVPADDSASNYNMAYETLLRHVPIPTDSTHRIRCEFGAAKAAEDYEQKLRSLFPSDRSFDLVLLGIGKDGHTASLFKGDPALDEDNFWVRPVAPQGTPHLPRVTLTPPVFKNAKHLLFMAEGPEKADALLDALASAPLAPTAKLLTPEAGHVTWLIDEAAASKLSQLPPI